MGWPKHSQSLFFAAWCIAPGGYPTKVCKKRIVELWFQILYALCLYMYMYANTLGRKNCWKKWSESLIRAHASYWKSTHAHLKHRNVIAVLRIFSPKHYGNRHPHQPPLLTRAMISWTVQSCLVLHHLCRCVVVYWLLACRNLIMKYSYITGNVISSYFISLWVLIGIGDIQHSRDRRVIDDAWYWPSARSRVWLYSFLFTAIFEQDEQNA